MHAQGSSHGQTRIFRRAYWEGDTYAPLLERAHAGWLQLDENSRDAVLARTGGLFVGYPDSQLVQGSRATAQRCAIEHEYLGAPEIAERFPAFRVDAELVGVHEPGAFMLFADRARLNYLSLAVEGGAQLRYGQTVRSIRREAGGTLTLLGDGWQVNCAAVVLAAGGWIKEFLPDEVGPLVTAMRIPVFEFDLEPATEAVHRADRFPVFLYEGRDGALVYGLPKWHDVGGGLKIGFHNRQLSPTELDAQREPPTEAERLALWRAINGLLPGVRSAGTGTACVYTMSMDESFIIGRSQHLDGVVYASACSGHGFKFAPGIGEVLAQLALDGRSDLDISPYSPDPQVRAGA